MILTMRFIVGILGVLSLASLVLAGADNTPTVRIYEDAQSIYNTLFAVRSIPSLKETTVFEKLKQLRGVYADKSVDSDEPAYSDKKRVLDLIRLISEEACSKETMARYNEFIKNHAIYGEIYRALIYYRLNYYDKCKDLWKDELYKSVGSLGYEKKSALMNFRSGIRWDYYRLPFYTQESLTKGVFEYLTKNLGRYKEKWDKKKGLTRGELSELYDGMVSTCSNLHSDFVTTSSFFLKEIASDEGLFRKNEGQVWFWVINAQMCRDIVGKKSQILDDIEPLVKPKGRRGFFRS